jgi:hypothetical protein
MQHRLFPLKDFLAASSPGRDEGSGMSTARAAGDPAVWRNR